MPQTNAVQFYLSSQQHSPTSTNLVYHLDAPSIKWIPRKNGFTSPTPHSAVIVDLPQYSSANPTENINGFGYYIPRQNDFQRKMQRPSMMYEFDTRSNNGFVLPKFGYYAYEQPVPSPWNGFKIRR